jgi:hypothetical protein
MDSDNGRVITPNPRLCDAIRIIVFPAELPFPRQISIDFDLSLVNVKEELRDGRGVAGRNDPAVLAMLDLKRNAPGVRRDDRDAFVDRLSISSSTSQTIIRTHLCDFDLKPFAS